MKNALIILSLFVLPSCRKAYTCKCFSDKKAYIALTYTNSYKEKKKSQAQSKCENDYKSSGQFLDGDYCVIE
jgi:hypothetical protein